MYKKNSYTSVTAAVIMQMINIMTNGGKTFKTASWDPSQVERPDIFEASDKAKPPP
jgi:hypothetical protein